FPEIVDVNFTAHMEDELDDIAEGKLRWTQVLDEFYGPFERLLEKKEDEIERPEEELDELCPLCPTEGREPGKLVIKLGRRGKFVGCKNWPDCNYTRDVSGEVRPEPEETGEMCPECGKPLLPVPACRLTFRGIHCRGHRRTSWDQARDVQGPPEAPHFRAAGRRDDRVVPRGLGGVRRGGRAGVEPGAERLGQGVRRGRDD